MYFILTKNILYGLYFLKVVQSSFTFIYNYITHMRTIPMTYYIDRRGMVYPSLKEYLLAQEGYH